MVEGDDLTQHFIKLAQRYPLEAFEKSMNEFIQMTLSSTEKPALSEVGQRTRGGEKVTVRLMHEQFFSSSLFSKEPRQLKPMRYHKSTNTWATGRS